MSHASPLSTIERLEDICGQQTIAASNTLSLLASASYATDQVRQFSSSVFTSVTTEGYPGARYHPGSHFADEVESIAIEEAQKAFVSSYANVQPHSASSANAAVLMELVSAGATIMGMKLNSGGHLTHGSKASFSGKIFQSKPYELINGFIDYDQVRDLAIEAQPRIIICGASSYPRKICFDTFKLIADEVGAILLADISHISGLVIAGLHPTPLGRAHVVTTSTYKQLSGPRGGLILSDHDCLPDSPASLKKRLNHAVFPLTQGTPDISNIASKAAALSIAQTAYFRDLMQVVVELAKTMAASLEQAGFKLITGGTDTHMILLDLEAQSMTGKEAELLLEGIGILANRNLIPGDKRTAKETSGLRIGTNILAARRFNTRGIQELVDIFSDLLVEQKGDLNAKQYILHQRVLTLCIEYPLPDTT
jgi:glycine hydroxymethyltransferase